MWKLVVLNSCIYIISMKLAICFNKTETRADSLVLSISLQKLLQLDLGMPLLGIQVDLTPPRWTSGWWCYVFNAVFSSNSMHFPLTSHKVETSPCSSKVQRVKNSCLSKYMFFFFQSFALVDPHLRNVKAYIFADKRVNGRWFAWPRWFKGMTCILYPTI